MTLRAQLTISHKYLCTVFSQSKVYLSAFSPLDTLFECVHSYYKRVYDVLSSDCPKCYRPAFMNSGKLAKLKERLTGLATKFDDKPRCYEGCTTDTVDYMQNLHDTFVEKRAASKFPFSYLSLQLL